MHEKVGEEGWIGLVQVKVPLGSFLSRVASRAQEEARAGCSQEDVVQELRSQFGRIDSYGSEGSQQVKAEEVCRTVA